MKQGVQVYTCNRNKNMETSSLKSYANWRIKTVTHSLLEATVEQDRKRKIIGRGEDVFCR
jgi:hypothetical protein